ncbi:MAG: helix-turn-helix domain-containing protein [Armatimonadetes bacterium]|nr:helix-turn-helix domain-containing protein [Armatimonadota bacterium]
MSGPKLTPEQAEAVLKADLTNLVRMASAGRPLSKEQRRLVQAYLGGDSAANAAYARNIVELAESLGVSRRTIHRHLKRQDNPGARPDGRYEVAAWRSYLAAFGTLDEEDDLEDEVTLRKKLMALKIVFAQIEVDKARGELMPVEEVSRIGYELGAAVRTVVGRLHLLASSLEGLPVHEIENRLKEAETEVMSQMNTISGRIEQWRAAAQGNGDGEGETEPADPVV